MTVRTVRRCALERTLLVRCYMQLTVPPNIDHGLENIHLHRDGTFTSQGRLAGALIRFSQSCSSSTTHQVVTLIYSAEEHHPQVGRGMMNPHT